MDKPIVLLIHGMGTHEATATTKKFKEALKEGCDFLGQTNFNLDSIELVEFNYSDILDKVRQDIAAHAAETAKLLPLLTPAVTDPSLIAKIPEMVGKISSMQTKFGGDGFVYTHMLDVILYAMTMYGSDIRTRCAEAISSNMFKAYAQNRGFHIVAHSLGTKVVTDTMRDLFDISATIDNKNKINPNAFRPKSLWMVSNVSRLVGILDPYGDPQDFTNCIVHDHFDTATGNKGAAGSMYNLRNELDPFTWFKTYEGEPELGSNITFSDVRKIEKESTFINPHDLTEYIANPDVTYRFLATLFDFSVTPKQYLDGMTAYKATTVEGTLKGKLENIKDTFSTVADGVTEASSLSDKFDSLQSAYEALQKINEETKAYLSIEEVNQ
jgi:hypothetical protein